MTDPLSITQRNLANAKILVVDDLDFNLELISGSLDSQYRLFTAKSGEEALLMARKIVPDLILLDVVMGGLDGIEVCKQIKADDALREIPVLFVTSLESRADEAKCWQAGASDFIIKPVNAETLNHRVRAQLTIKLQTDFLRKMVYLDGLTSVYNRRYFDVQLPIYHQQQQRDGNAMSLLMIDIDHFKEYNDAYGHLAGDECLRFVAKILKDCIRRPRDIVTRYGGEEFAILLSDTDRQGARHLAKHILAAIRKFHFPSSDTMTGSSTEAQHRTVTVSIGIATCTPQDGNLSDEDIIHLADSALYEAKASGRNCCREADTKLRNQMQSTNNCDNA